METVNELKLGSIPSKALEGGVFMNKRLDGSMRAIVSNPNRTQRRRCPIAITANDDNVIKG